MVQDPEIPIDDIMYLMLPSMHFFPTCQVRVVRFYVSCFLLVLVLLLLLPLLVLLLLLSSLLLSSPRLLSSCSLPDFNHDHPRPVCPAGPQPRPSTPSVPCRTSTASIRAQCSLPDLNHDHPRPVFPAGPQPQKSRDKSFRQKWCQQAVLKCHGGDHSKQSNFYSILCVYLTYLYFMYIPSGYLT